MGGKSNTMTWEDTVFEFRNKKYGAYLLRYNYPRHLTISALSVIILFLSVMIGIQISNGEKEHVYDMRHVRAVSYNELTAPPPIQKKYVPPKKVEVKKPKLEKPPPPEIKKPKIEKYVAPVVVQEEVEELEEMPTIEEVKEIMEAEEESDEIYEDDSGPFESDFDTNPSFPGGVMSLEEWLRRNLKYPVAAKRMGIEGKVIVGFLVDTNGKIYDVSIVESLHRLCDREAMRLVRLMPAWIPGVKNGAKISGKYTVPIPFILNR